MLQHHNVEPSSSDSAPWKNMQNLAGKNHYVDTHCTWLRIEAQVVAQQTVAEKQTQLEEAPAGELL